MRKVQTEPFLAASFGGTERAALGTWHSTLGRIRGGGRGWGGSMSGGRKQVDRIVPKERRKVAPTGRLVWASVLVSGSCCNTLSYT